MPTSMGPTRVSVRQAGQDPTVKQIGTNVLKEGAKITPTATTVMDPMFVFVQMDGKDEIVKSM